MAIFIYAGARDAPYAAITLAIIIKKLFIQNKDIIFYRAGDIHSKLAFQIAKTIFKNTVSYRITCKKCL